MDNAMENEKPTISSRKKTCPPQPSKQQQEKRNINEDPDNTDNSNEVVNETPNISLRKTICPIRPSKIQQQKKKDRRRFRQC
ncbi:hypothetical protein HHI36_006802 [Cryptolaemus montrouzieri]|uniref:Uncharacterized protein n=1 Tax=Cryptolaemus montrouzieri TaxID=559131 RepID=A0ABD2NY61_9CUCU